MSKPRHIDPEYEHWFQKYPTFPGVAKCVELLKRANVRGAKIDIISWQLKENAAEHLDEVMAAIRADENTGIRLILMGALEDAALPESLPMWEDYLQSAKPDERQYAERALRAINTKEARRLLWEYEQTGS